jgi:putative transposase
MNKIDAIFTELPFYGTRRIKKELRRRHKLQVNRKCVRRLMKKMGLEAIYPKKKPNTSDPNYQHQKYLIY